MSYMSNAMIEIQEAGCVYLPADIIEALRTSEHRPVTTWVPVSGKHGIVPTECLIWEEALRLRDLVDDPATRDTLADALDAYDDLDC